MMRFHRVTAAVATLLLLMQAAGILGQRPDAPPYGRRGPLGVGTRDFTILDSQRPLEATVWYPALNPDSRPVETTYRSGLLLNVDGQALRDAEPDRDHGPYPLVVFSHGSGGFRFQSLFFTEHLASYGFIVIAADHPGNTVLDSLQPAEFARTIVPSYTYRPADVLREIAFAETLTAPGGALEGMIGTSRIAVTGHSFGGYTALAASGARLNFDALNHWCDAGGGDSPFNPDRMAYTVCFMRDRADVVAAARGLDSAPTGLWPAITDPRIQAVVVMAPWNGPILGEGGLDGLTAPTMILVGSSDSVTPPARDANPTFDALGSATKALVTFENADHYIFVNECWELAIRLGFFSRCSDSVWDMARVHDLTNHFATAFLLAQLTGDEAAQQALAPQNVDFTGVEYTYSGENK